MAAPCGGARTRKKPLGPKLKTMSTAATGSPFDFMKTKTPEPGVKQAQETASVNSLAELHRKDRRTIKRAILEAGLFPVSHEGGHPRYDLEQAEAAIEDYEIAKLPPWNPTPAEARKALADLSLNLFFSLSHMAEHGGTMEEAIKAGVTRRKLEEVKP